MSQGFDQLDGFDPTASTDASKRAHLHDDLDTGPEAHHHTIGLGPDQAVSYPLAKSQFDARYSNVAHTHSELTGDNLIVNGDASLGDAYWTRVNVSASSPISANRFISQLSANPSSCTWKSEMWIPVQGETVTGQIKYQGSVTGPRIKVDVLWNDTGALPDISDGVSTTVSLLPWTTIALVDTDDLSTFSWTVPGTATAARLIVTTDNGSVTSGFPVNVIFDDVQLISKLREVSPLYVGVTDAQVMEGPLTITDPYPLSLPDGAAVGKILKSQNSSGDVAWGDDITGIKYIQDTAPVGTKNIGDLWRNSSKPDVNDFIVFYTPTTLNTGAAVTADSTYREIAWETLSLDIPCDGVLEIDFNALFKNTVAGEILQYRPDIKNASNLTATKLGVNGLDLGSVRYVNAGTTGSEPNHWGKAFWKLSSVGSDGGNIELMHTLYLTAGSSATVRWPRWVIKFTPYLNTRIIEVP